MTLSPSPLSIALASPYTPPELLCLIPTQDTLLIDSPESPRAMHPPPCVLRRYGRAGCYMTPVSPVSPSPVTNRGVLSFATQLEQLQPATDNASTFVGSQVAACSSNSNRVETGRASNSISMVEHKHLAAFIPLPGVFFSSNYVLLNKPLTFLCSSCHRTAPNIRFSSVNQLRI